MLTGKLHWSTERTRAAIQRLADLAVSEPGAGQPAEAVTGDATDDAILACAVEAGADVLVTGNKKHLLPLGEHRAVRLLTPQALLAELRAWS